MSGCLRKGVAWVASLGKNEKSNSSGGFRHVESWTDSKPELGTVLAAWLLPLANPGAQVGVPLAGKALLLLQAQCEFASDYTEVMKLTLLKSSGPVSCWDKHKNPKGGNVLTQTQGTLLCLSFGTGLGLCPKHEHLHICLTSLWRYLSSIEMSKPC